MISKETYSKFDLHAKNIQQTQGSQLVEHKHPNNITYILKTFNRPKLPLFTAQSGQQYYLHPENIQQAQNYHHQNINRPTILLTS